MVWSTSLLLNLSCREGDIDGETCNLDKLHSTFHCGCQIYIASESLIDLLSALKGKFEAESEREENETAVIRNRNRRPRGFAPQLESSLLPLAGKNSWTKKSTSVLGATDVWNMCISQSTVEG